MLTYAGSKVVKHKFCENEKRKPQKEYIYIYIYIFFCCRIVIDKERWITNLFSISLVRSCCSCTTPEIYVLLQSIEISVPHTQQIILDESILQITNDIYVLLKSYEPVFLLRSMSRQAFSTKIRYSFFVTSFEGMNSKS